MRSEEDAIKQIEKMSLEDLEEICSLQSFRLINFLSAFDNVSVQFLSSKRSDDGHADILNLICIEFETS